MNILNNYYKLFIYTFLFSIVSSYSTAISSDWSVSETSKLRLISPFSQNDTKNLLIGLEYEMEPGWKTYWKSPGDGGFAQSLSWENSTNVKNVNILWPTPIQFEILGLTSLGYQNNVIFPLEIELEDELKNTFLNLHVNFLICKEVCIPGDATLFLEIPSGEKKLTDNYFNLEKALSLLPEEDFNSSYIKEVNLKTFNDDQSSTLQLEFKSDKVFYNPKIFLHSPFGLPVIKNSISYSNDNKKITTNFNFEKNLISEQKFPLEIIIKDKNHNFKQVLDVQMQDQSLNLDTNRTYFYFIFISLIAGLILNVMPCVFPVLSIKLMSVFSSEKHNTRVSFITTALGIITSFVLLGLIFFLLQYFNMSIAWGMQFQNSYFLIFITLVMFLFMMNMFGQFEIILPSKLNNLSILDNTNNKYLKDFFNGFFATLMATPCSAPFVGTAITAAFTQSYVIGISIFLFMGIGMSLPYLFIASFPKLINFLPKPGKWMVYIKYILGFLLLATVLWLLNILSNFFNNYFLISLIIFFLVLSYRQQIPIGRNIITILVLFTIFSLSSFKVFQQNIIIDNEKDWLNFFDVEIDQLVNNKQLVFLDITADWCATCQFNKLNVLNSEKVIQLFKDNKVTLVRADWTRPNRKINIFLEKYDRFGIPFNAFFSNNFPEGLLLSELLSEKEIVNVINKINNE
ncbi:protein-disulfide reductase DsbD family protein [Alphaproteobacteria bacterium]|nr:protein-disulfide reductase DsbD family protein [Alphaproteobacteria bacterium]